MKNTMHTPGPYKAWPVDGDRLKRWMVLCVNAEHCPGTGKLVLAERVRTEANARLFAAAPKLLEACETALHELRVRCGYKGEEAAYVELSAAIAEATGRVA